MSRIRGAAAGIAAIALVTTAARAEAPPIRVEYQAHAGCPAVPVLLDEITRRTHLARFAAPGEPALGMLCVLIPSSVLALTACGTSILGGGEQRRRGGDDEQLGDRWHTVFAR